MKLSDLRTRCIGKVIGRDDREYAAVRENNWNQLRPDRFPDLIVQAAGDQDVAEAIRFAREASLKVAVRGGGHAWCGTPLRKGGMMIDLSGLNEVKIDPEARTASIQPFISNRDLMAMLEPYGLAFPVGHCPQVKASGYLLSGGIAWNAGQWGHACASVTGVEMVTADAQLVTADAKGNRELFWAARGAGAGMFAVATRFHLKLLPRPRAIYASTYYYPLSKLREVAQWFSLAIESMPRNVEMTLFLVSAPEDLRAQCSADQGKVCMITATVFADADREARETLEILERCPHASIRKTVAERTDFEKLFTLSGSMWPEFHRNKVETLWSNSSPAEMLCAVRDHFKAAPNPKTLVLFALYPGWAGGIAREDMALSKAARVYGGPWTIWEDGADDAGNVAWHRGCCEILKPFACGRYLGESDILDDRSRAEEAFSPENWKRLNEMKARYDPDGIFHGFFGGL
jgi:FAD/FMN-containing dehydrogenase